MSTVNSVLVVGYAYIVLNCGNICPALIWASSSPDVSGFLAPISNEGPPFGYPNLFFESKIEPLPAWTAGETYGDY